MAFVAQAPIAVAMTDSDVRFTKASPAWLADFGMTEAELVGRSSYELAPETRGRYEALHRRSLDGEKVTSEPERVVLPNGDERWMMWDAAPWREADGAVGGLLIISRDVTALKQAEEEVRRTRAFLDTIVENVPVPLVVKSGDDGRIVMMNRANAAFMQTPREELIGKSVYDLFPREEAEAFAERDRRVLELGAGVVEEEQTIRTANNGLRHTRMIKTAVTGPDGRPYVLTINEDITERKAAQAELEQSWAFLNTILDNVPAPMVVKDEGGRILLFNRAMERLYGIDRKEHLGRTVTEIFPGEVGETIAAEDRAILAQDGPLVVEDTRMSVPGLGERIMRKTKVAIRTGPGTAYMLAISEDVTERTRAQEELQSTKAFLTTVIDNLPAAITVKNASDGRLLMTNPAASAMYAFGQSGDNRGKTNTDVFPPDVAARFEAQDREVMETGEMRFYEEEPLETTHGTRYLNRRKVLIRNADGPDYLLSISEDVTERRKALSELERTRAFLATVIDAIPAGITVKDATDGRLLMMNPAVEDIYDVGRGVNLGKTGGQIFPEDQALRFAEQDRKVIAEGGAHTFDEEPVWTQRGERFLRRKKVLIRNPEGPDYLLSISEDMTERKLAQDALKEALARAEAASVAKSEFLANMSHEIRTPLNGVLGLADALQRMELSPRQREIVGMIVSSGQALTAILSDVLDLAKAESGQLQLQAEPFSLKETIGSAAFLFETVARSKGVDFKVAFDSDSPDWLVGDALRIRQIVSNLISNAVKFTSEGEVSIRAGAAPLADGAAELTVVVKDTGAGFTEEVRKKLFSRFEQGDGSITRRYGGTGLGLSIAGALAQMMDGAIDCTGAPGEGATFTLHARLAVAKTAPCTASIPDGPAPTAVERPLRVLLAEDHEVNQKVVQLMLAGMAELVIASNGKEAIEAFLEQAPFDVVLMDTQMPVMDGLTAIELIREHERRAALARTPIVSLTANAMAHQVEACLKAGADVHLAKPITSEGLYTAIRTALDHAPQAASTAAA